MISLVPDLSRLAKTNIRTATECNSFLCCHTKIQQWQDLLKTKEGNLSIACTTYRLMYLGVIPKYWSLNVAP
jgi:hypothetical protein